MTPDEIKHRMAWLRQEATNGGRVAIGDDTLSEMAEIERLAISAPNGPAPQVHAMVTSEMAGQNVEADRAAVSAVTAAVTPLCDERPAGYSNPADAGPPDDTPRTNAFFASCEKVTGWNHLYSKQAAFCRTLERKISAPTEARELEAWRKMGEVVGYEATQTDGVWRIDATSSIPQALVSPPLRNEQAASTTTKT